MEGLQEHPEWAAGLITVALINAGLAQSKNRSGTLWFVVSLFLFSFATFLLVACEKVPESK